MHQRLYEITMLLIQKKEVTADALAERFEVSRRTIYRDIDALSAAGVPVYTERGKGGGIRIMPEYVLDKALFSKDEQAQLLAAFGSLAQLGAPDIQPLQDKLAALFGESDNWLQVDFAPWGGGEELPALFRLLRHAIFKRQVVAFDYSGAEATAQPAHRRRVDPYRVVFRGQSWYLHAFDHDRHDWRLFKLSRMRAAELLETRYRPDKIPPPVKLPEGPMVALKLKVQSNAAFRVDDEFYYGQAKRLPDGGWLVECTLPEGGWLVGYLLSFGADAEVLAPDWLRARMARQAERLVGLYGPAGSQAQ